MVGDVGRHGERSATVGVDLVGDALHPIDVSGSDHHGCTRLGERLGDAFTDALAATGDDGDFSGKIETVHVVLPC